MLVDDDCIRSLPAEPNFCAGAEKVYRPLSLGIGAYIPFQDAEKVYRPPSLGMGAYTPFRPLSASFSVENTDASVFFTEYSPERCL